eukprot:gene6187-2803_t
MAHAANLLEHISTRQAALEGSEAPGSSDEAMPDVIADVYGLKVEDLPTSASGLADLQHRLMAEQSNWQESLLQESEKKRRWREENIRRRHNFLPLLFELLRTAAEEGQMEGLVSRARKEGVADK